MRRELRRVERSMQLRRLEEAIAVAGLDAGLDGLAVAIDRYRDFDAGGTERPHLAIQSGKLAHLRARDRQQYVAGAQIRLLCGAVLGQPDDHQLILDRGGVEAEPGPRRLVRPPQREQVVEDRLQQIDRHDHVEVAWWS